MKLIVQISFILGLSFPAVASDELSTVTIPSFVKKNIENRYGTGSPSSHILINVAKSIQIAMNYQNSPSVDMSERAATSLSKSISCIRHIEGEKRNVLPMVKSMMMNTSEKLDQYIAYSKSRERIVVGDYQQKHYALSPDECAALNTLS